MNSELTLEKAVPTIRQHDETATHSARDKFYRTEGGKQKIQEKVTKRI